ncbi:hypothetical protein FSB73_18220 [Arachidicoccus ginsenosidivorans]|uniref:Uncharacterized protein n=1 Tax=Arachidicoccus ginsenosidivorans TaxID=496057 RepID=A0A5B8VNX4_9BACT|nr:hypothetical protein [Arachidicoccus ginsenosidivorans]QEC73317.1 hypothetical protein FSB73_18220 [Arachidicoccus ginsenosidivorans]
MEQIIPIRHHLEINSLKNRIVKRIPRRKRQILEISLVGLSALAVVLNVLSWIYIENLAYLTFVPIFITHYLIYKYQQSVTVIKEIFYKVHEIDDFKEWQYETVYKLLFPLGLSDKSALKRYKKSLRKQIRKLSAWNLKEQLKSKALILQLFCCAISPVFTKYDSIQSFTYNLCMFVCLVIFCRCGERLTKAPSKLLLLLSNKYYIHRDLKKLNDFLNKIEN